MKKNKWFYGLRTVKQIVIVLSLLCIPLTSTYAACCAGHGGVASCNKTTGYKMCKDKTASPTCTCPMTKKTTKAETKAKAAKKTTTTTTPTDKSTTTTKPVKSWWGGKSTTKTPVSNTSAKGCCSHHGGVSQCNKATHHQMCKDGTASPGCTCE